MVSIITVDVLSFRIFTVIPGDKSGAVCRQVFGMYRMSKKTRTFFENAITASFTEEAFQYFLWL